MEYFDLHPMEATPEIQKNGNSRNGFWQGMLLIAIFFTSIGLIACGSDSGGGGDAVKTPDIELSVGVTTYATDSTLNLGEINAGVTPTSTTTLTISNVGTEVLNLTGSPLISFSGTDATELSAETTATVDAVSPGGSTSVDIVFTPVVATIGARTAQLTILSDDPDEGTYTLSLTAANGIPNIEVWGNSGKISTSTADYDQYSYCLDYPDCTIMYEDVRTYTIKNTGTIPLNITLPMGAITGTDAADFTLDTATAPTTTPVPAGGSTDFDISFLPEAIAGTRSAKLVIVSDDPDEGNFTLLLSGFAQ